MIPRCEVCGYPKNALALIDCACPKPEAPTCDCGYYQRTGSTHNFNCATLKPTPEAPPREFTLLCENGNGWWKVVEYPNGFHPKGEKFKVIEYAAFETEDEFSRFRYTRRELMVMKTALIELDSMGESK